MNDSIGAKYQPLTKLTTQYSLLLLKTGYASKLCKHARLYASCSLFKDMNFQGSFTRVGHRAAKFETRTEGSLMPTICTEGVCVIIQITILIIVGPFVSRVQLSIPPVLVQVIIKRNGEHDSECFVDAWNVVGHDSDNSRCDWPSRLARSVNNGKLCRKKKKRQRKTLPVPSGLSGASERL